ncbi:MAG: DUF4382 domain-containing protein [Balneolales bacterium]
MIQPKIYKATFLMSTLMLFFVMGCDTDADPKMGSLEVRLHDAPADYEEVNVFVESVQVNRTEDEGGWETISEPNQSYNLLALTNGVYEVIGEAELEAGTYPQIRLILSQDNNNVVIDGNQHNLFIPSGSQTGIKIQINAEIKDDITYLLLLDFDADRSVVKRGQGAGPFEYLLKPVIRASNEATSGNIEGQISPVVARPAIYAINGTDTLSTTYADTTSGEFRLVGLAAGNYTVSINSREDGYDTLNIEKVTVTEGETNDLEAIELSTTE